MSPADADLLMDYLTGHLSDRETSRVQTRLKTEPSLADALIRMSRDEVALVEWSALQAAPPVPAPVRAAWSRVPLAGAAIAAAVLVGGLAVFLAVRRPVVVIEEVSAPSPGARIVAVRGEATLETAEGKVPATVGRIVRPGDRLRTGDDGEAVVHLPDDARIELHNSTAVCIPPPDKSFQVDIDRGSIRTEVGPADANPMTVCTPHAVIQAAAALTLVAVDETTVTAEGTGARTIRRSDNRSHDMSDGETVRVDRGTAPMVRTTPRDSFRATTGSILSAAVSADGLLAYCTSDARAVLHNLNTGTTIAWARYHGHRVIGLAFSVDGKFLVATSDDRKAYVRDGKTGDAHASTPKHRAELRAAALSPDGTWLATGTRLAKNGAEVRVFDATKGTEKKILPIAGGVNALAFSPDGKTLVAAGSDSAVRFWTVGTWIPQSEPVSLPGEALSLAYAPDGKTLAVGGRDGLLKLIRPGSGEPVVDPDLSSGNVVAVAFSPDGTELAAAIGDAVWVWDVTERRVKRRIAAHRDRVTAVAYTPDGRSLVTTGADGMIRRWDVE